MGTKRSPHIRPILYPTSGKHPGGGAEYRTSAEVAAMNDEHKFQPNVHEQRVGKFVIMSTSLALLYEAGDRMQVEKATVVEGGVILHLRDSRGALFVVSETQVTYE